MQNDFFSRSHKYLTAFLAIVVFGGYTYFVFAAGGLPPPGGFDPGTEIDPGCNPGDLLPNPCIVNIPDGDGGVTTLTSIGSSPNANGATITGSVLNLEPASALYGGVVTTTSQTFSGAKTFNDGAYVTGASPLRFYDTDGSNFSALKGAASITTDTTWTLPSADSTGTQALVSNGSGALSWSNIVTGPAGSNTQVQYNNSGAFGASAQMTFGTNANWNELQLALGGGGVHGSLAVKRSDSINFMFVNWQGMKIQTDLYSIPISGGSPALQVNSNYAAAIYAATANSPVALITNGSIGINHTSSSTYTNADAISGVATDLGEYNLSIRTGYYAGLPVVPTTGYVDGFLLYSTDIAGAGTASPHFYTEDGYKIVLGNKLGTISNHDLSLTANNTVGATLDSATGNFGIGDTTPAALLTVGNGDLFQVNASGDLERINNVWYTWPTARVAGGVLTDVAGDGTLTWAVPSGGGITALGPIGSSPNANGATITGSVLNLEPASALYGGVVDTSTQTFEGEKTFQVTKSTAGTLASAAALTALVQNTGAGTITNTYGLKIQSTNTGVGSVGISTGVWIQSLVGSTKYAIYADIAGSKSLLRDVYLMSQSHMRFYDADSTNYVALMGPANVTTNRTWTLPATDSTGTQALVSNGSGTLSWSNINGLISVDAGHNVFSGTIGSGTNLWVGGGGTDNILFGYDAGYVLTTGFGNVFLGYNAGYVTSTGQSNVFMGTFSGSTNTTGRDNVFIGSSAGDKNTIGNNNTYIGVGAGYESSNGLIATPNNIVNATAIGAFAQVLQNNSIVLGGTGVDAVTVGIGDVTPDYTLDVTNAGIDGDIFSIADLDGECLHNPEAGSETISCSSDERLKRNIKDSGSALNYFKDFRIRDYDVRSSGDEMTGVIAQEVQATHPELVTTGSKGLYSVQLPNQWKVIKAIQELDTKISKINASPAAQSDQDQKICIGETCLDETDLKEFKSWQSSQDPSRESTRGKSDEKAGGKSEDKSSEVPASQGGDADTTVDAEVPIEGDEVLSGADNADAEEVADDTASEDTPEEEGDTSTIEEIIPEVVSDLGASVMQIFRMLFGLVLPNAFPVSW